MSKISDAGVTPAEIEEQRAKGWPDFHPEDYCHKCGGPNVVPWFTASELWNIAVPEKVRGTVLCPRCFVIAYEKATGEKCCWKLVPEGYSLADDPAAVERARLFAKEAPDKWRFLANADIDHGDYPEYLARGVVRAAERDDGG